MTCVISVSYIKRPTRVISVSYIKCYASDVPDMPIIYHTTGIIFQVCHMCACMRAHVYMCVGGRVCACGCMHACVWRADVHAACAYVRAHTKQIRNMYQIYCLSSI